MNIEDSYHYQAWVFDQEEPDLSRLYVGRAPTQRHEIKGWQMRGYNPDPTDKEKEQSINEYMKREEMTELQKEETDDEYLKRHGIT